jgi:hypothetical protein
VAVGRRSLVVMRMYLGVMFEDEPMLFTSGVYSDYTELIWTTRAYVHIFTSSTTS